MSGSVHLSIPAGTKIDDLLNAAHLYANTANRITCHLAEVADSPGRHVDGAPLWASSYLLDLSEAMTQAALHGTPA
jgi:hypothetical protein